jgi:hypothetical protein
MRVRKRNLAAASAIILVVATAVLIGGPILASSMF